MLLRVGGDVGGEPLGKTLETDTRFTAKISDALLFTKT
jgi:hypothetical protein